MKTQEQLKRDMYAALDKIRRAKKHPSATAVFETALEAYLESVRAQAMTATAEQLLRERDDLQARLHAVDTAYAESQKTNEIAGDALRLAQERVGYWRGQAEAGAEHRKELHAKIREVTKHAEDQLVVIKSQREAFGELYVKHHQSTRKTLIGGGSVVIPGMGNFQLTPEQFDRLRSGETLDISVGYKL